MDGTVLAADQYDPSVEPESDAEAEERGPDERWKFWDNQIQAALRHENRWRVEALDAERLYFGPDGDPGRGDSESRLTSNQITDETALIHANIDVLKPLIFSETPQPVVRRRFRGDGKMDPVDLMAAEAGQRVAQFILDTEDFDGVMEAARDDWLISGRGTARVVYRAEIEETEIEIPGSGQMMTVPVKVNERVSPRRVPWRRCLLAPAGDWEIIPWIAFETPMTRGDVEKRFGPEVADGMSFTQGGLINSPDSRQDSDRDHADPLARAAETGELAPSPFDVVMVWEIWNRQDSEVIWWTESHKDGVLDEEVDTLELEHFWPMPKPLMATTRGESMTPRPDIKYYQERAKEVKVATGKLKTILKAISVSGLYPGQNKDEVNKLLNGDNVMVGIADWISLMEKGGMTGLIQWLPLNHMITAIQALISLREQSKQAMFEASGVSDIMRAQGDPGETATAQQIKGRYAGLRLSDRQRKMAHYARDMLRLMLEVALEHFDSDYLLDITGLDLPATEQERQMMIQQQKMMEAQYQQAAQMHQQFAQMAQARQMPVPPPPEKPEKKHIPDVAWETVYERLRTDYGRKISLTIETQSTVLADEQADKEARIEFLSAFSSFVAELAPLAGSGQFDYKTTKELLLFGVRGFPKSRTLEAMITSLPDEPQGEPPEDTQVKVAKIKAEVDKMLKEMDLADREKERQHEAQMAMKEKGVDLVADAMKGAADAAARPAPSPQAAG